MFNINLIKQSGLQTDSKSKSKVAADSEFSNKLDLNNKIDTPIPNNEPINPIFFLLIMLIFIILMLGLIYFRGEMSFINNLMDQILVSINQFF